MGIVLTPAVGAALMSASTVVVAINAKLLERRRKEIAALGLSQAGRVDVGIEAVSN